MRHKATAKTWRREYAHTGVIVEELKRMGVDCARGYALGRPQPIEQLVAATPVGPARLLAVRIPG